MSAGKWLLVAGGAALALFNGHYVARYVWLNAGQKSLADWVPLIPELPRVRTVDWTLSSSPPFEQKLTVLQSYTANISKYADLSAYINSEYSKKKGYDCTTIVKEGPADPRRNPCWDKVYYITQQAKTEKYDWIFWIDSDAIITDNGKEIESIAMSAPSTCDIFICTSIYFTKNINTGAMLMRVTPWLLKFLDAWWNWSNDRWHQTMCHEQSALDEMISKDVLGIVSLEKIAMFGPTEFNSTYQHGMRVKGKMVQHYRGCSTEKRVNAFLANIHGSVY